MGHQIDVEDVQPEEELGVDFSPLINWEDARGVHSELREFMGNFVGVVNDFLLLVLWEVRKDAGTWVCFLNFCKKLFHGVYDIGLWVVGWFNREGKGDKDFFDSQNAIDRVIVLGVGMWGGGVIRNIFSWRFFTGFIYR